MSVPNRMMFNHWPSLLLIFALLIGFGICLKRLDYMVMDEVRALISVLFGFATSCLLLSFIWIIQRKPLNRSWPNHGIGVEVPNMHPRGRMNSVDSLNHIGVSTISSSELDPPPNYENALIHSKPINWELFENEKYSIQPSSSKNVNSCSCYVPNCNENNITNVPTVTQACRCCQDEMISSSNRNHKPGNNVALLALSIVKGFTHIDPNAGGYNRRRSQQGGDVDRRKASYTQLDVNQLVLSSSPPKYSELPLSSRAYAYSTSNNGKFGNSGG